MQVHDLVLISQLLSKLEKKAHLERAILNALFSLGLGFAVLAQSVQAAGLVDIDLLVLVPTLDKFVIYLHRLPTKKSQQKELKVNFCLLLQRFIAIEYVKTL